jgi:hypothetical protein
MAEHVLDARRAFSERAEEAGADGVVVRDRAVPDARGESAVHVLEVHVAHASSGVARDLQRIRPTERDVSRIEAKPVRRLL